MRWLVVWVWLWLSSVAFAAQQTFIGGLEYPEGQLYVYDGSSVGFNTNAMNALSEYAGCSFVAPVAATISSIGFNVASVSSFVGTADGRIETITATTGLPTGTEVGDGTDFTPTAGWTTVTMTTNASLTAGTRYFVGSKITAYTSGSYTQDIQISSVMVNDIGNPNVIFGPTPSRDDRFCLVRLRDSGGNNLFVRGMGPATAHTKYDWSSSTNPNRRGVRFNLPFPVRFTGVVHWHEGNQDYDLILYDSDGTTALETVTVDVSASLGATNYISVPFTPRTLNRDVWYRLIVLPGTTTASEGLLTVTVSEAEDLDSWPGGQNFHYTTVNGAPTAESDWTNTTTQHPMNFELIFNGFDDGAGSGSRAGFFGGF